VYRLFIGQFLYHWMYTDGPAVSVCIHFCLCPYIYKNSCDACTKPEFLFCCLLVSD
jgi:hypothetical protein